MLWSAMTLKHFVIFKNKTKNVSICKTSITWQISAQAKNFGPPTGLKFRCDYVANLISAREECLKLDRENLQEWVLHSQFKRCACPIWYFSPGWNLLAITWGFSARLTGLKFPARFEKPGCNFKSGLRLSSCNCKRLFKKICSGNRAKNSARPTGLKFQPGL